MNQVIATLWLISFPFWIVVCLKRGRALYAPKSRFGLTSLNLICFASGVTVVLELLDADPLLFGTPLFIWSGFLLLCYIWIRGIYLLSHPLDDPTATERPSQKTA